MKLFHAGSLRHVQAEGQMRTASESVVDQSDQTSRANLQKRAKSFLIENLDEAAKFNRPQQVLDQKPTRVIGASGIARAMRCRPHRNLWRPQNQALNLFLERRDERA